MQKILYIPIDTTISNTFECEKLVKRGDTLILTIKVFNNAKLADLTGQAIDLILKKPDNTLIEKTITSVSNGVITATLDVQATNVAGTASGEVQIYTSDTLASTNTFTFVVDTSLADDVLEASKNDIEVLADLKNTITAGNAAIDKYKENVEAIASSADAVEALADIKLYINTNLADLQQANAQATTNISNETEQNTQAVQNISDLTAINNTSSTLKSELDSDISNGNTLKSGLESDITNGNELKSNLETDFTVGNQLKSNLESTILTGDTLKTNLDTANTQAEANIEALNALGDVTEIAQDVTNLKNEVETARGTYNNLDARLNADESNITSNSNKIGDLSANGLTEANLATAIKNDRAQLSENTQQLAQLSNPNLLINGDFQVWQRGTPITGSFAQYLCDRWISTATSITATKNDYGIHLVKVQTDGSPNIYFRQKIELSELKKIKGKNLIFSVLAKSSSIWLQVYDRLNSKLLYGAATSAGGINTNGSYKLITLEIPSFTFDDNINYLEFSIMDSSGTLDIQYAKLEIGDKATPLMPRTYGEELALCQRYYEATVNDFPFDGMYFSSSTPTFFWRYKVTKRVAPTVTIGHTNYGQNYVYFSTANYGGQTGVVTSKTIYTDHLRVALPLTNFGEKGAFTAYGYAIADAEIY